MIEIDVQIDTTESLLPSSEEIIAWAEAALIADQCDICIRIVDEPESRTLNKEYRQKNKPTNVLSFPHSNIPNPHILLGDIVICAPLVRTEAQEQNKSYQDHFAHLIIHGMLHLQGFDHMEEADANKMEATEIQILAMLDINNPYSSHSE